MHYWRKPSGSRQKEGLWSMSKKLLIIIAGIIVLLGTGYLIYTKNGKSSDKLALREIQPVVGDIRITFSTTGVVEPQNRLEIKPPISGRIEEILVQEGDRVSRGQIVAWMSSSDRAALLDSARAQGKEALAYWKDVYKATPLISPIDGEVIVRAMEPGQTVSTGDAVIVVSDRLIVKAQFDETDIGRVHLKQAAVITLDAYPDAAINGMVDHIAYESQLINNVTIYEVDIVPQKVPPFFRSGMSTSVEVIEKEKKSVLLLPVGAVTTEGTHSVVTVRDSNGRYIKREIKTGLSDGARIEIIGGLTEGTPVIVKAQRYTLPEQTNESSPFMFRRPGKKSK